MRTVHALSGVVAVAAELSFIAPVPAAPITWGSPTGISGDTDVDNTGTLFGALNLGTSTSTTVNGVGFTGLQLSGSSTTSGDFTFTAGGGFVNFLTSGSTAPPFSNLSSSYQTLLASIAGVQ